MRYLTFCVALFVVLQPLTRTVSADQQSPKSFPIVIDASQTVPPPGAAVFGGGDATNPQGETIGMNTRYLTLSNKPWLPVMGEFHYTRVPEAQWEDEILKMKAAGVQIIATYVIWIHQEEVEGQFDWSGRRNLRHFVQLCAKHGMYVWLRIGPWDHGEVRNGGFPNWLLKNVPKQNLRQDDPIFMKYVSGLYAQIGDQVKGLTWANGGPIIGIQLENEYSMRGPHAGAEYILALKKLALANGLNVPIYSVTGWDNAVVPKGAVVAVFGGYPDAPWDSSLHRLPPQEVYAFRFGSRATGNMGVIGTANRSHNSQDYGFPFMTAEMGGGVEDTYHRRPVIRANDIAAMVPVLLGSGVNLYGTYMFQGGENPNGKLSTLQESQATGYPTDVPVKSYDFQAPLSEFGEEREVLKKLKVFNYFLNDFGSQLAPMVPFAPAKLPASPQDLSAARVSVRTDGKGGFLFFNNYVRYYAMPDRPHFQVRVELPNQTLAIPDHPVNLPSGAYGIWPFGLNLGDLHLRYATAELFSRTVNSSGKTYYFVATAGVPAQFVFEEASSHGIKTRGKLERRSGAIFITGLQPSLDPAIVKTSVAGYTTSIVLLSREQAENAWKLKEGSERLLITPDQFFSNRSHVILQSDGDPEFHFTVVPALSTPPSAEVSLRLQQDGEFASVFHAKVPKVTPQMTIKQIQQAGKVPPVKLGPPVPWRPHRVAMAPSDQEFSMAAKWKLGIPQSDWDGVDNLFLQIDYDGDVARLMSAGKLLDDNFYNGKSWRVGLDRFRQQIAKGGLELEILPRRADAPIFLERRYRDPNVKSGQIDQIDQMRSVKLVPQYKLDLDFSPAK